jgi:drug/metabolite transporter (DMT)-like permease
VALAVHAVALARGGVILVQTILSSGLIMALAIEAVRERRRMRTAEVVGSLLLVAGVVLLLGWGQPGGGRSVDLYVLVQSGIVVAVVAAVGLAASRHRAVSPSAVVMGAAAGVCFALDAVMLKGFGNYTDDLDALPAIVSLAGFVVASLLGNLIVQRAYQRAPLRVVLPAVSAADPVAAFLAGVVILDERLRDGMLARVAVGVGLALIVLGIVLTTTGDRRPPPPPPQSLPNGL